MDHLPLPQHPTATPRRARCVCTQDDPYDRGDFATFPVRAGWPQLLSSQSNGRPFWSTSQESEIDAVQMRKQEQVFTAWVFFGLLHTALSPFGLYNAQDYIDCDSDGVRWLHTRLLLETVSKWYEAMHACDEILRRSLINDLRHCYRIVSETMTALSLPHHAAFDRMIRAALMAICNMIEKMVINFYNPALHTLDHPLTIEFDNESRQRMLQNGWCPSDIFRAERRHVADLSVVWFAEHMQKTKLTQSHTDCSDTNCQRARNHETRHVTGDCACEHLQSDKASILACLASGDYPVLEVEGEELDDITLRIRPAQSLDEETAYVAISHVWSDGLGNAEDMSLPRCQILRLAKLVQRIPSHTFYRGRPPNEEAIAHKKRLLLWIDTLCCPVELAHKQVALSYMRDVYMKAEWSLVLDNDIQCYSYAEIGVLEAAWRIVYSRWMTRLWTYQEGGLPLRVLVQFSDAPVSVFPIMTAMSRLFNENRRETRLYINLCAEFVFLRQWMHSDTGQWLSGAVGGVAHRSVSVASDEPLCLATVLGLDTVEMSRTPPDERMRLLWTMICRHEKGIRKSVIFNTLARLEQPGLRCFPASFLQELSDRVDYISLDDDPGAAGTLLMHGFRTRCAGWRICLAQRPASIPEEFFPDAKLHGQIMPANKPDGTCYNVLRRVLEGTDRNRDSLHSLLQQRDKEWYIVLKGRPAFDWAQNTSQQMAILVSKEVNDYGLSYYRTHLLLNVDRVTPRLELPRRVQYIHAHAIWKSWPVRAVYLLSIVTTMVEYALTWPPVTLTVPGLREHNTIASWLQPALSAVYQWPQPVLVTIYQTLFRQIVTSMKDTSAQALRHPLAAKLWREAGHTTMELTYPSGDIIAAVMGRTVNIIESYDELTEWVID